MRFAIRGANLLICAGAPGLICRPTTVRLPASAIALVSVVSVVASVSVAFSSRAYLSPYRVSIIYLFR